MCTLEDIGFALFRLPEQPMYFDRQTHSIIGKTKIVEESQQEDANGIILKFDVTEFPMLAKKVLVHNRDNMDDSTRYQPIPLFSFAKLRQEFIASLNLSQDMLAQYGLENSESFQHDMSNFERIIPDRELLFLQNSATYLENNGMFNAFSTYEERCELQCAQMWCEAMKICDLC